MAQVGYTPISLYYSATPSATPSAGNLANGELALNVSDGKLFYKDNGGVVQVLATKAGASGDVVGPGSSTDNALVRFDGTTGKLVQNSAAVLDDSGNLTGLAAVTTSGALTLNGGTANGVAYLNGSKVLTTGSALTFDGTNLGVAGRASVTNGSLSGSGNGMHLYFDTASNTGYIKGFHAGVDDRAIRLDGLNLQFAVAASEQMRLTSTGLGIGTSSPSVPLTISKNGVDTTAGWFSLSKIQDGSANKGLDIGYLSGSQTTALVAATNSAASNMAFWTYNGSSWGERMRLDSSGNLGLGVTPSASSAAYKNFQVGQSAVLCGRNDSPYWWLGNNWTYNAGDKYIVNGYATLYGQQDGKHVWWNAPSGTAGNAISFTQAMTLDASGNLSVGATSSPYSASGRKVFAIDATTSTMLTLQTGSTNRGYVYADSSTFAIEVENPLQLILNTIGANPILFKTSNTERARIDSSGNLLVGTTSTGVASGGIAVLPSAGQTYISIGHVSGTSSGSYYLPFLYNGTIIGGVTQNGTTGVLYNLTSDYRLKNNPVALTGAKAFVMALQPKTWDWWDGSGKGVGFIAHEFMEVAKYSGNGTKDAVDADGKPVYQSIQPSSSEVMANLVALIQEQQNTIDQLKARLDAANL